MPLARSVVLFRTLAITMVFLAVSLPAGATAPPFSGPLPPAVSRAFQTGALDVPAAPHGLGTSAARTVWRVPIIMIGFRDMPLRYSKADFDHALFDSTDGTGNGTVFDYYRWTSRGVLRVIGEVVATVTLPRNRADYAEYSYGLDVTGTPSNSYGALRDAMILTQASVDWSKYDLDHDGYVDMVWLLHAGPGGETSHDPNALWSITTRTSSWRLGEPLKTSTPVPGSSDRSIMVDRFSVLPELSGLHPGAISEVGVFCHEFGHALGLPDLYDTSSLGGTANVGPGNWSLMSTGIYGANGVSPESPAHLGAWPMQFLGWDQTERPTQDQVVTLPPIATTGSVLEMWFQGEQNSEHFLIENRQKGRQFDRTLPFEGMIVYHIDETVVGARVPNNSVNVGTPGLVIVEGDGDSDLVVGRNHGDGSDPFPGALNRTHVDDEGQPNLRSFSNAVTQLAIRDIQRVGADMRFTLQVRAPGWQPIQNFTEADYAPLPSYSPASTAGQGSDGTGYVVRDELRDGRPQIVLHTGRSGWSGAFQVSSSPGAALDPTLAVLPGNDLAVVWSDTRAGNARLYYRARMHGHWTDERPIVTLPGTCSAPAIAADRSGTIDLAFQYTLNDQPQVMFMRFTYRSPFGLPRELTTPPGYPSTPAITVSPAGVAHVLWIDRPAAPQQPQRIWAARFNPDSGMSQPFTLTRAPTYSQTALAAVTDAAGTLHVVWQVSGPGTYELHYQRRWPDRTPSPRDTVMEQQTAPFQAPILTPDRDGGLHLAYEGSGATPVEIHYRRWTPERGWDYRSTDVSEGVDGTQPVVLPQSHDAVTVLFTGYIAGRPQLLVRQRLLPGTTLTVPPAPAPAAGIALRVGPNPLRRGAALELSVASRPANPWLDVYDIGGRRLASVELARAADGWRAELPAARTLGWPAGVYFARPRGEPGAGRRWVMLR